MKTFGTETCGVSRAAVIGAGSMGGGIAAQFANAGIAVDLLDIVGPDDAPNSAAEAGIARQLKTGGFMTPGAAKRVTAGNTRDHLDRLSQADWIVEVVIEDVEIKRALYAEIDKVRRPGSVVSSNTSTILRAELLKGMGADFARNFVITHFFNPPRHMQLVELVSGPENSEALLETVSTAARILLGKTVIDCRDTPGFIANRIGCFWMASAALLARDVGLDIETADAVHTVLGIPRTGVFGLFDIVGIDLVPHVWGSLLSALPKEDALHGFDITKADLFTALIEKGHFGRKSGAGFYRKSADGTREALDLATGDYRPAHAPAMPEGVKTPQALIEHDSPAGRYARQVLDTVLAYATTHATDIAEDRAAIDAAVALGYGWSKGPFALGAAAGLDGAAPVTQYVGKTPGGPSLKDAPVLAENDDASLLDIGDGVACFAMHTKMNAFAPGVFDLLELTLGVAGSKFDALVLGNDNPRAFSVGADLAFILGKLDEGGTDELAGYVKRGQDLFLAMRREEVPVVAAAHGFALGGGCEFMLHAHHVIAHAELTAGLPETKVGLIPAWGGCTTLLLSANEQGGGPLTVARTAFAQVMPGTVAASAPAVAAAGILPAGSEMVMHRGDLLGAAKSKAKSMAEAGHVATGQQFVQVTGPSGKAGLLSAASADHAAGRMTDADFAIADALAGVLTGGEAGDLSRLATEEELMALERAALLELAVQPATRARMDHMLKTGKPLRN